MEPAKATVTVEIIAINDEVRRRVGHVLEDGSHVAVGEGAEVVLPQVEVAEVELVVEEADGEADQLVPCQGEPRQGVDAPQGPRVQEL